ncbi:MAG: cardiolipin synthase ClsB [Pseudomonadota bacterium]
MPIRSRLLEGSREFFPSLIADIDQARESISLETYLLHDDPEVRAVLDALARARSRGLEVRLVFDGYGSAPGLRSLSDFFLERGLIPLVYAKKSWFLGPRSWRRLHRKLVVIDHRIAYVGGINLLSDWWDPTRGRLPAPRYDLAVRSEEPSLAQEVEGRMSRLWLRLRLSELMISRPGVGIFQAQWRATWRGLRNARRRARRVIAPGTHASRMLWRDNLRHRRGIERAIDFQLAHARREILIAMAYFLPRRQTRTLLCEAARRGVRVRVLMQGQLEFWWARWAEASLMDELTQAGVEMVGYRESYLHAKAWLIDDWVCIGSSNMDPVSLLLSLEANLSSTNAELVQALRASLEAASGSGRSVTLKAFGATASDSNHWRPRWAERIQQRLAKRLNDIALTPALLLLRLFARLADSGRHRSW